jgi:signal transduction histidine kinase
VAGKFASLWTSDPHSFGRFFWQMNRLNASLQHNAKERARMVASIVEENLKTAAMTGQIIDQIVTSFLHDKARFIEYLDSIESMQQQELTALARETGLRGITLIRPENTVISAPEKWQRFSANCSLPDGQLYYAHKDKTGYIVHHAEKENQNLLCIIAGLNAEKILNLQKKTSLPVLLGSLSSLPGINFIHLKSKKTANIEPHVILLQQNNTLTAIATLKTSLGLLEVGLDAQAYQQRRQETRDQFITFGILLLTMALFFSWLLSLYQKSSLKQATHYERMLAREHEAAAMGRTTATIAHEIRNPLNAINIGLQRLQIEADNLTAEQKEMLTAMRHAVGRTSSIVSGLQRFSRKLTPDKKPVQMEEIANHILSLYKSTCNEQNITFTTIIQSNAPVAGDKELLTELLENLMKNSIEAQPEGGFIQIVIQDVYPLQKIALTNGGVQLSGDDKKRIGEPYFTTKTRGTGLGLALCKRIAEAHKGKLAITTSGNNTLTVAVTLPLYTDKQVKSGQ